MTETVAEELPAGQYRAAILLLRFLSSRKNRVHLGLTHMLLSQSSSLPLMASVFKGVGAYEPCRRPSAITPTLSCTTISAFELSQTSKPSTSYRYQFYAIRTAKLAGRGLAKARLSHVQRPSGSMSTAFRPPYQSHGRGSISHFSGWRRGAGINTRDRRLLS